MWTMYFAGEEITTMTDEMHIDVQSDLFDVAKDGGATWLRFEATGGTIELLWSPGVAIAFKRSDA